MTLTDGEIVLRPIKMRDQRVWREVNRRNRDWLRPWEGGGAPPPPPPARPAPPPPPPTNLLYKQEHTHQNK
ncbi:hypothetical protein ACFV0K_11025, partial [Streptomyces sp. NPDC059586]